MLFYRGLPISPKINLKGHYISASYQIAFFISTKNFISFKLNFKKSSKTASPKILYLLQAQFYFQPFSLLSSNIFFIIFSSLLEHNQRLRKILNHLMIIYYKVIRKSQYSIYYFMILSKSYLFILFEETL